MKHSEEYRTSVGSGRKKTSLRLSLDRANLIMLLENNSIKDIANMFDSSLSMVYTTLTEQFKKREIGNDKIPPYKIDKSIGVWDELKNTGMYKMLMNN